MKTLWQTLVVVALSVGMLWAQNVGIGTATPVARLNIEGGGTTTEIFRASNDVNATKDSTVVISASGNVGIGTVAPTEKLQVEGNIQFSGALMPGGNAGTTGQVLVSQGAGNAPQWQDPSALTGFYKLLFVDAWNPSVNNSLAVLY